MRPIDLSTGKCDDSSPHRNNEYIIHTFKYMPESFFQSTDRAWLGERNLFCSTKIFFLGGGGLGVWKFCRLSLIPQKKKKKHCRNFTPSFKVKTHINHQFVLLIVGLSWVMLLRGRFRFINWVHSENWPPWRDLKLTFQISPTNTAPQFLQKLTSPPCFQFYFTQEPTRQILSSKLSEVMESVKEFVKLHPVIPINKTEEGKMTRFYTIVVTYFNIYGSSS